MVSSMITRYGRRWRIEDGSGQLEWNNGFLPASSWGWDVCAVGGTGMGPRMREDNGWGWILACVFMGVGSMGGDGFVPASSRGQALCGGVRGWVPACARTTVGGWILACVLCTGMGPRMREDNDSCLGGTGMGPRMREENGWGWKLEGSGDRRMRVRGRALGF